MGDCGVGALHESALSQPAAYITLSGCMVAFSVLTLFIVWVEQKFSSSFDGSAASFNTAGNAVGIGLGASVIVSQWTWAATLQQSSTVAFKYGVSGPFWYASGATIQIILFAILAVELKRRAPNCKTFLEIIRTRYGRLAHVVYTIFALTTNVLITAMLLLGGAAALNAASGCNKMIVSVLMPLGYLIYTFIGGLKAKIVACYFNTVVIMVVLLVFCFEVYFGEGTGTVYTWDPWTNHSIYVGTRDYIGSFTDMWLLLGERETVAAFQVANDSTCEKEFPFLANSESSFLTMSSNGGLMFGIINIIGNFGTVFIDQSNWQNAIASRPDGTVKSFFLGGIVWFCVPFTLASGLGLAAQALGGLGITLAQAETGIVPMIISYQLLGPIGLILFIIQLVISVLSTGASELTAISSLITYDFYQTYYDPNATCEQLKTISQRSIIIVGILMGTLGIILDVTGLSLGFVYLTMGIIIGSAVVPVGLTLMWKHISAANVVTSAVVGLILGVSSWLCVGRWYGGSLSLASLGSEIPMLTGNMVSLFSSAVIAIVWGTIFPANYDFKLLLQTGVESQPRTPHNEEELSKLSTKYEVHDTDHRFVLLSLFINSITRARRSYPGRPYLCRRLPKCEAPFLLVALVEFSCMESKLASYGTMAELGDSDYLQESKAREERKALKTSCRWATGFGTVAALVLTVAWPIPMYFSGYRFSETFFSWWAIGSLIWACLGSCIVIFLPIGEAWPAVLDVITNLVHCRINKASRGKIDEIEMMNEHWDT